jgi:uncharacterized phiE125 gp8 family phage protein
MALKLITGPEVEPLTLAQAKAQCRIEHDDEDDLIEGFILTTRRQVEHLSDRPLITQVWEQVLDGFPCGAIELGKANVLSIVSLKYLDLSGDEITMASDAYSLDAEDTAECWLHPAYNTEWPSTIDTANAVRVRFTCGYGASADEVPEEAKTWMRLMIGHYYRNREAVGTDKLAMLPGVEHLLDGIRIRRP